MLDFQTHPIIAEIDTPFTAHQAFALLQDKPYSFLLDSALLSHKIGRYSFMGRDPFLVLKSRGKEVELFTREGEHHILWSNPLEVLRELLEIYSLSPASLPLEGGVVGYFSYDLCHLMERLPAKARDDLQLPECYLAFYDVVVAFDHLRRKVYVVSTGFPVREKGKRVVRAEERLEEIAERLAPSSSQEVDSKPGYSAPEVNCFPASNFQHQEYLSAVEAIKEYIAAGDVFQVNLSQRFETDFTGSPYELYRRLCRINPAPFAAFLHFDEMTVVCASPERFLRLQGDVVETRPIKGTRPRGKTSAEDRALAEELLRNSKDKAEHVMIVDLERNDLGQVCEFGTVKVRELMTLEPYATVFHLVSTVEGRLHPGKDRLDLLRACFPGGSITGAPKVRAMEIIDELEPTRRSIYTGSLGYLSFGGSMDLNIVIRSILIKGKKAYCQVGGGVVYDSDPEREYQETLDKARALFQALSLSPQKEVVL